MSLIAKILRFATRPTADARRLLSMNARDLADIGLTKADVGRMLGCGVDREGCCSL